MVLFTFGNIKIASRCLIAFGLCRPSGEAVMIALIVTVNNYRNNYLSTAGATGYSVVPVTTETIPGVWYFM